MLATYQKSALHRKIAYATDRMRISVRG